MEIVRKFEAGAANEDMRTYWQNRWDGSEIRAVVPLGIFCEAENAGADAQISLYRLHLADGSDYLAAAGNGDPIWEDDEGASEYFQKMLDLLDR